jgi:hypothetical protein
MLSGRRYHSTGKRIVGALLYTLMAGFAIFPLVLSSTDLPDNIKNIIISSHSPAISIGIVVAVVDNFITRHNKVETKKK